MSLSRRHLAATLVAMMACVLAGLGALAGAFPDSTWVALAALPHQGRSPVFALAVDPFHDQNLIAGNSQGSLLRSTDGGSNWTSVHKGSAGLLTVAFSPFNPGVVLAGTHGSGALASKDDGMTWTAVTGLDGRDVRVFAFALTLVAAGTDRGVYTSPDGSSWTQSGLAESSIDALAVTAVHVPVRLVAGSDKAPAAGGILLSQSTDAGATWTQLNPAVSGTFVARLAAGPLPPPPGDVRPLILGTNAGIFISSDGGANFTPLSGGSLLPSTDYTQIAFVTDHFDRFYAASDGGGSDSGGLWRTDDSGQNFRSMLPPLRSVTALAVSNDEAPILYVATFRPVDHVAALWAYHDTGAAPQGPSTGVTPSASSGRGNSSPRATPGLSLAGFVLSSRAPYIGLGVVALVIILLAVVSHFRGVRR